MHTLGKSPALINFYQGVLSDQHDTIESLWEQLSLSEKRIDFDVFDFVQSEKMAEFLLSKNYHVRPEEYDEYSQLFNCAPGMAKFFIAQGLNPRKTVRGRSPIYFVKGRENVKTLLDSGENPNGFWNERIKYPVPLQDVKCLEAAEALLENGANPDVKDVNYTSLLGLKMFEPGFAQLLLRFNAKVEFELVNLACCCALRSNNEKDWQKNFCLLEELIEFGRGQETILHFVAFEKAFDVTQEQVNSLVNMLLQKGKKLSVGLSDSEGNTPLHHCVSAKIALALLENGAPVNALNSKRETPLHMVMCHANDKKNIEELTQLFLDFGADIDARNEEGRLPEDYALANKHHEALQLIQFKRSALLAEKMNQDFGKNTVLERKNLKI